MATVNNNFYDDVGSFIQENKWLCILTLGLAIVAYSLGTLAGRTVSWIKECYNTTKKTDEVANQVLQTNAENNKSLKQTKIKESPKLATPSSEQKEEFVIQTKETLLEFKDQLLLQLAEYIKSQENKPTYERARHAHRGKLETLTKEKTNPPIPLNKPPKGINLYAKESVFYGYNAEGVRDDGWGCAWRAMQTCLSHYGIETPFAQLFHLFGPLKNLQRIYQDKYPKEILTSEKAFAPYDLESGWGEPFIGEMMLHFYGIASDLEYVNDMPDCKAPRSVLHDKLPLTFSTFKDRLIKHFGGENPAPVMIDDGLYTLNIIGVGSNGSNTTLWISDPHIKEGVNGNYAHGKTEKTPNGLYTVTLDENGNQLKDTVALDEKGSQLKVTGCSLNGDDEHQKVNMFNINSSIGLHFSAKHWMILFPKKSI